MIDESADRLCECAAVRCNRRSYPEQRKLNRVSRSIRPTLTEGGAPDTIRTCGLHLRRVALYPAELRVHQCLVSVRDRAGSIPKAVSRIGDHGAGPKPAKFRRSFSTSSFKFASVVLPRPRNRFSTFNRFQPNPWFSSTFSRPATNRLDLPLPSEGGALSS